MTRPDDIPQDVWDYAEIALKFVPSGDDNAQIDSVARAILAEREQCAKIAEARKPLYGLQGQNACAEIASSIRKGGA